MPIFLYECEVCKERIRHIEPSPKTHAHCEKAMKQVFVAPEAKFMEKKDPEKGKSILKDQNAILKARARDHSRNVELDDMIQSNNSITSQRQGWLAADGKKRKKIDDL